MSSILQKPIAKVMHTSMHKAGNVALQNMQQHSEDAFGSNEALLMRILKENSDTEYGRKYGFKDIHSIQEYQQKVPLSTYDNYAPYIERMIKKGEKNLLTAAPVVHYATSSGTIGVQKLIPQTEEALHVYEIYSGKRMVALAEKYYKEDLHSRLPLGKEFNALEVEYRTLENGTPAGAVSGSAIMRFKKLMPYFMTSPLPVLIPAGGMNMKYMKIRFALEERNVTNFLSSFMTILADIMDFMKNNWEMICDDIENGTINPDMVKDQESLAPLLPYLKKNPKRAQELREIFRQGFDEPIAPKLWPKLSYVSSIGTGGFAVYAEKLKKYTGDVPIDYMVYAASEGIFAAASAMNDTKYDLLTDSCFFEFLPMDNTADPSHPLTLNQLEEGKEYEIIITNLSGFYRYRIKDVIRVNGFHGTTPQITFAYRISQMVNIAGEKTTEEHLNRAVKDLSIALDCHIDDYCLYEDSNVSPARYCLLIETDKPLSVTKLDEYARLFDEKLGVANVEYGISREHAEISAPLVLLQQPQSHALWRDFKIYKGSSQNQVKPVRVLDSPQKEKFFLGMLEEGSRWEEVSKRA